MFRRHMIIHLFIAAGDRFILHWFCRTKCCVHSGSWLHRGAHNDSWEWNVLSRSLQSAAKLLSGNSLWRHRNVCRFLQTWVYPTTLPHDTRLLFSQHSSLEMQHCAVCSQFSFFYGGFEGPSISTSLFSIFQHLQVAIDTYKWPSTLITGKCRWPLIIMAKKRY